jgi:TolB-like protein/DNA-binding winged helix-turn-helix (wHTH) protein
LVDLRTRTIMPQPSQLGFRFGEFSLNVAERRLSSRGACVSLTPKVFDTLLLLVDNAGRLVEKEAFLKHLWPDAFVEESSLAQNISVLRRALGDDGNGNRFIDTVPKRGYRFVAEVRELVEESSSTGYGGGTQQRTALPDAATAAQFGSTIQVGLEPTRRSTLWVNLPVALAAVLVIALGTGYIKWKRLRTPPHPVNARVVLAVLPFQNLSGDAGQEYLSDGLTEEMITQLGRIDPRQLGVIARTSAMTYKGTQKNTAEIGRELGVDYVLEGSVRREASRVRVSAQLIQTTDQTHIWAQNYDRDLSNLLALQGEVAQSIAAEIQIKLTRQSKGLPPRTRSVDVQAYEIYLRDCITGTDAHKRTYNAGSLIFDKRSSATPITPWPTWAWLTLTLFGPFPVLFQQRMQCPKPGLPHSRLWNWTIPWPRHTPRWRR